MLGNRFGKQKQSEYYCKRDIQQNRCITQVMRVTEEKMQIKKYNVPLCITNILKKCFSGYVNNLRYSAHKE